MSVGAIDLVFSFVALATATTITTTITTATTATTATTTTTTTTTTAQLFQTFQHLMHASTPCLATFFFMGNDIVLFHFARTPIPTHTGHDHCLVVKSFRITVLDVHGLALSIRGKQGYGL